MNNKVNYTLVGVFVLIGIVLILSLSYWMLKPSNDQETQIYSIYFDESVLGLNLDAPVKYRGISVGKVTRLRINPKNSEQVEVQATILKTTPIKESTVARLTAQGITGLTYINLTLGSNSAPKLVAKEGETCPVIQTVPSFFENIEQSLGGLSVELSQTLQGTHKLLKDSNQKDFSLILKNTAELSARLNKLLDDNTIANLQKSSQNLESLTHKIDAAVPNVNKLVVRSMKWQDDIAASFDSIMKSYIGITASMTEFKRAVASGEFNLKEISADVVPTMNDTFLSLQELMIKIESTLEQYKRSPSDILYKQEAIKKAPGEQ
jgi:phospholipid/cholesterol/gamma-HCH transport system substrate-binding protein